jgi:hypothetical protein
LEEGAGEEFAVVLAAFVALFGDVPIGWSHARLFLGRLHVELGEDTISKGPELSNPMDPNSEPTGKTIFVIDEYYESPAGIARHWQDAMDNWPDMSSAVPAWSAKATVVTLHNGTAVQALW